MDRRSEDAEEGSVVKEGGAHPLGDNFPQGLSWDIWVWWEDKRSDVFAQVRDRPHISTHRITSLVSDVSVSACHSVAATCRKNRELRFRGRWKQLAGNSSGGQRLVHSQEAPRDAGPSTPTWRIFFSVDKCATAAYHSAGPYTTTRVGEASNPGPRNTSDITWVRIGMDAAMKIAHREGSPTRGHFHNLTATACRAVVRLGRRLLRAFHASHFRRISSHTP